MLNQVVSKTLTRPELRAAEEARARVTPSVIRRTARSASLRTAIPHDDTPNPYGSVVTPLELTPDLDPNYDLRTGVPPDGYAIALAVRQTKKELEEGR